MKLVVVGVGYVGLVSGVCFAECGHEVVCVDKDKKKIINLNSGIVPIYEPGLEELVIRNRRNGRLTFTTTLDAVKDADAVFIAVGTPPDPHSGHADLRYVFEVASELTGYLDNSFKTIVIKSTVPVGTGKHVEDLIKTTRPDANIAVVSNPEFLREGHAIEDFQYPDRVVIGTDNKHAAQIMCKIYSMFDGVFPIVCVKRESSELIKYGSNSFLATKIAFINEMADLCEKVGADILEVAHGIGSDSRIGSKFLQAGPGFAGSCFPKDILSLVTTGRDNNTPIRLIETVIESNECRKLAMAHKIQDLVGNLEDKTVSILGLTFKPNTDDMREACSLTIIPELIRMGAKVKAYDPIGMENAKKLLEYVEFCPDIYSCIDGTDVVAILTEWDDFYKMDLNHIITIMKTPQMVDLRNIFDPAHMRRLGFKYSSIGRE